MISDECEGKPEHEGFVYVLSHEAMPRLLKIGCTVGPVEKRAAEIANATGVPGPFRIEKKFPVYVSPRIIEKKVHEVLSPYRTVENREFFRLSIEDAVMFIRDVIDGRFWCSVQMDQRENQEALINTLDEIFQLVSGET